MDTTPLDVPPQTVLDAWAVSEPMRLEGGQGGSFRTGDVVLKPTDDAVQAEWLAEELDRLAPTPDLRVIRPIRSSAGQWVVGGWTAWRWIDASHRSGVWDEVLEVSQRFHRIVANVAWSPAIAASHRWAIADRVAWGELEVDLPEQVRPLLARRVPVSVPSQLVHGDLGGNVLFHGSLPPAVIDVSPYWRPAGYADAIVVADAVAWHGAGDDLVEAHLRRHGEQLILRAVVFRVAVDEREVVAYQRMIGLLEA